MGADPDSTPVIVMAIPVRSSSPGRNCSTTMGSGFCAQRKRSVIGGLPFKRAKTHRAVRLGRLNCGFLDLDFSPPLSSKPNFLSQLAALFGVIWGNHRIDRILPNDDD